MSLAGFPTTMKHSYFQPGIFRAFQTLGVFLTSLTLLTSCSNELEDFSSDKEEPNSTIIASKEDSVLRFLTIDELENISVSEIPGKHDGYELKELSYECVDTIELRALRFDVKAKLRSSSNQEKIISFSAEVGPDLVSVEYYPGGEMIPAHDNMLNAFYPKVERYRNYSDGSRIGPDEFYDYGHFIRHFLGLEGFGSEELFFGLKSINDQIPEVIGIEINPEMYWYENGTYRFYQKTVLEYNINTTVIEESGKTYSGEDLLPIQITPGIYDPNSFMVTENWHEKLGHYYHPEYYSSREYDDDPATVEILNLCRDVEDVSPNPFPKAKQDLSNGWYFALNNDQWHKYSILNSRYFNDIEYTSFGMSSFFLFHSQYLIIDGRIIHFDDIINKDYSGIKNLKYSNRISKEQDGYLAQFEYETSLYGEGFKALLDVHIKLVDGSSETIDRRNYNIIANGDHEELNKINNDNTRTQQEDNYERIIQNNTVNTFIVDECLPKSINGITTNKTINK